MTTRTWIRRLFARKPGTTSDAGRPHQARPRLEQLEHRLVPTVNLLNNFRGLVSGGPPDSCGAAGPDTYIETVNSKVAIYDKGSGKTIVPSAGLANFFSNVGGRSEFGRLADATSCYDEPIGRFIVADLELSSGDTVPSYLDLCVSTTSNPRSLTAFDWHFYQLPTTEGNNFSDYPGNLGYNHDALVVTFNMASGGFLTGTGQIDALSQSDLAAGGSVFYHQFDTSDHNYRPVTMHDSVAGGPMWLVQCGEFGGSSINLVRSDNILGSTALQKFNVGVASYGFVNAPRNPDGSSITDTSDSRILKAAEANNIIAACQNVGVGFNEDDARWYEFNVSDLKNPTLVDQGNVGFGPNTYAMYPGIDINAKGDLAMSVSRSGNDTTTDYMSVWVIGRTAADAPGQMDTPVLVRAGDSNNGDTREGDFSGINLDPNDGTFWTAAEYTTGGSGATQITHFQMTDTGQAYVDGSGILQVVGSNAGDNIVLKPNPLNSAQTEVINSGKVLGIFNNSSFTKINVALLAGNDTLALADTGGTKGLGFFAASVTVDGDSGSNSLSLDDSTSGSANGYTISSNGVGRSGFGGVSLTNVQNLNLADGTGANTASVLSTSYGLTFDTNGQDSIFVGSNGSALGGNVQAITGGIYVFGSGAAFLTVDDSGDTTGRTATVSDGTLSGLTALPIQWAPTISATGGVTGLRVYGGSGGNTFAVNSTSNFFVDTDLNSGSGNDTVIVKATTGALFVENSGGQDGVYVGSNGSALGGNVQGIHGFVDVSGAGATSLTIDDGGDSIGRTATMTAYRIDGLAPTAILWTSTASATGGVTGLSVYGSSGGNTITVSYTSNFFTSTTLNAGTGNDNVYVQGTGGVLNEINPGGTDTVAVGSNGASLGGNVQGIDGAVNVAGTGTTYLIVDDGGDAAGRTPTLSDGAITGLAPAAIDWTPTGSATGGVAGLTVYGGTGANTFTVANTSGFYSYTYLDTLNGNDTVNVSATTGGLYVYNPAGVVTTDVGVGSVAGINGYVIVYGPGTTTLLVDDHLDTSPRTVSLDSLGDVSGLGNAGNISFGSGVTALTVDGSSKGSTYDILNSLAGTPVTVNGGVGNDTFNLGNGSSLAGLLGAVTVNGGGGTDKLNANDSGSFSGQFYNLSSTELAGSDFAIVTYALLHTINVTGSGNDTLGLLFPVPTTVTNFNGGSGTNTLQGADGANAWTISGANSGKLNSVTFSNFQYLIGGGTSDIFKFTSGSADVSFISGGTGGDTNKLDYSALGSSFAVTVNLSASTAALISGGFSNINVVAGSSDTANTLIGPDSTNLWTISGNSAGKVNASSFSGMPNLVGGTGVDTFKFSGTGGKVLSLNGGGAPAGQGDWLDYAPFPGTSTVTVNLATGSATNVNGGAAGAVTGIQHVIGSAKGTNKLTGNSQGNILIGGNGANTLKAGRGGSLLIGGSGHGSITGGAGSDILIAGTTKYDATTTAGQDALMSILLELQSTDSFAQKVSDIIHGNSQGGGSDLNGGNQLTWGVSGATVQASKGLFTLAGDSAAAATADWFFCNSSSTVSDFNDDGVKDEHNNNSLGVF